MAMKFTITTLIFFYAITTIPSITTSSIIPIHTKFSPLKSNFMHMVSKDLKRVEYLSKFDSKPKPFPITNYVTQITLGTPGQVMFMNLDTSMDDVWIPCTGCPSKSPTFTPNSSTTYGGPNTCSSPICPQVRGSLPCHDSNKTTPCFFNQTYEGSTLSAVLVNDSITLGIDKISNFTFGCVKSFSSGPIPAPGLLGLGRGPMSLVSQTIQYYNGEFSYCLPSYNTNGSGLLTFGTDDQPKGLPMTPLLSNPYRPSLYYVNLTGVSVGNVQVALLNEYLAFDPKTGSGTIIDSGTVVTRFVEPVYFAIRDEFRNQVKGPFVSKGDFDTCFVKTNKTVAPLITFHFTGLNVTLPLENNLVDVKSGSLTCLVMASSPNNTKSYLNVIGSFQQQNLRILIKNYSNKVGIGSELCK